MSTDAMGPLSLSERCIQSEGLPNEANLAHAMQLIDAMSRNVKWWTGDVIELAIEVLGEDRAHQLIGENLTSMNAAYLRDAAKVSRSYSSREFKLSWTHYESALRLSDEIRERLLTEAQAGQWDSRRMKDEVRQCLADAEM